MKLSATQAGIRVDKTTATITRAIKSGKLSATKLDGGGYEIDPSELFRVFPPATAETPTIQQSATPQNPDDTEALRLEVERLREALRGAATLDLAKQAQIEDLRDRLDRADAKADREAEERRKLTAILTDQRTQPIANENPAPSPVIETPPPAPETGLLGRLWAALLGR